MPKRNQTRRRNKRGGFWSFDDVSTGASSVGSDISRGAQSAFSGISNSLSGVGSSISDWWSGKKTDQYGQAQGYAQAHGYAPAQGYGTTMPGGRKRGGAPAAPYNPAEIWLNQSKYPQSVGGKRTRHRGRKSRRPRK